MTNGDAIAILKYLSTKLGFITDENGDIVDSEPYEEAINEAIRALKETSKFNKTTNGICNCFRVEFGNTVCYGTREKEKCKCNGDRLYCDFYKGKL